MARASKLDSRAASSSLLEQTVGSHSRLTRLLDIPGGTGPRVARLDSQSYDAQGGGSSNFRQPMPLVVGRYALFEAIASGGMASVHIGRLLGAFGFSRTVAIKRLHRDTAVNPEFISMFSDEARLAARIHHPNVVPTLDVVALGDELLLVMEYVSGAALSQILTQERKMGRATPHRIAVDIMIGVLNGLHAAHEATSEAGAPLDIVHRDVSPQNILVGTDGVARVLDFGIAKAVGGSHRSLPNQVKGKLRYLSPESVTAQRVTRATDIYSASVVLWEMLAGRRLFNDQNNAEVVAKIMNGVRVPPSHFQPHLSRKLDDIVMCGLNRDPNARHATARVMARALEAAVTAITRSTVSAWVSASVGSQVRERDGLVARIERDTGAEALAEAAPSDSTKAATAEQEVTRPLAVSGFVIATRQTLRPSNDNWRFAQLALCAAACIVTFSALAVRRADRPLPLLSTPGISDEKSLKLRQPGVASVAFAPSVSNTPALPSQDKPVPGLSKPPSETANPRPPRQSVKPKPKYSPLHRRLYLRD
jgi:serine/threonine protein kinase